MKTIEEAANYHVDNIGDNPSFWDSFKAGVEFAQQWIPIEEEMPATLKRVECQVEYGTNRNLWTIIAKYVPYMTVREEDFMCEEFWGDGDYNEKEDQYYTPEGWYESNLYSDVNYKVSDKVVSWRPIERK